MLLQLWRPTLVGYETLCYLMVDDPDLVQELFDAVGSRLFSYYKSMTSHPTVGACMINDDWGFKTGTLLSPEQMRRYVFPWHHRMVEVVHESGKYAILHSCGKYEEIFNELCSLRYDGRHSYEDAITPVEKAYKEHRSEFSILGGLDVDFLCRASPREIYHRAKALLAMSSSEGKYALGSGNSIAGYIPPENYFEMLRAALEEDELPKSIV